MMYAEYVKNAMDLTIVDDYEGSGISYLSPDYRAILIDSDMEPFVVEDYIMSWPTVKEILKLEVERRNSVTNKSRFVIDWLFQIITSTVDPAMIAEENDLMKNIAEYMKLNHELKEKERELDKREEVQEKKDNLMELMPGMNFSKR